MTLPDETFPTPAEQSTHPDQSPEARANSPHPAAAHKKSAMKNSSRKLVSTAKKPITYSDAGVDISSGDRSKQRIKMLARKTFNRQVLSEIGGFGGLFALDLQKYPNPVLVSSCDGVGTKLKVAFELGIHHTVGQDLVNHCVNDIAVQGASPLFFLDYLATGKLDNSVIETVVQGLSEACRANGCALIGGETAQMPGFYADNEYDLAGTIIGAVNRDSIITGENIQVGDILIGLPSNGLHTNGYSLARKLLFEVAKYGPDQYVNELKDKTGAALMRVHRSYLAIIKKLTGAELVNGMAHITGGGITENLPRIIPKGMGAVVDLASWTVPPLFEHLQHLGNVEQGEMLRTFNMGIGLIVVVPAEKVKKAKAVLNRANERHCIIGRIVRGERKVTYN
ncbi:phosphoribosylformylglycinamidine cyclo-ligase [Edaphobacter aggregans]|uniref:Phosphoribosylformylglycinamidine cyclo-ligase n=2 Tax=Edaphobacter aggregans TaxID=570835 RepID=A0A428MIA2_9BACT|nr:phosphoribosylformylglycinamidine cyclo-ligase [Edaphobacter aggregans]